MGSSNTKLPDKTETESSPKSLNDYWHEDPMKVVEMYRNFEIRNSPENHAWFEAKSAEIRELEYATIESFTLPYGNLKGKSLIDVSKHHPGYFKQIIQTPFPDIKEVVQMWVKKHMEMDYRKAPVGKYAGQYYDHILELDPSYIFSAMDGKELMTSEHILSWARENIDGLTVLRQGFVGENMCGFILESFVLEGLSYEREYTIKELPRRRYDYKFDFEGHIILLEYDGAQHFKFPNIFHRTRDQFDDQVRVDIEKTRTAIASGYKIIRIAYLHSSCVRGHITKALRIFSKTNQAYYFSAPELYTGHIL